MLNSAFANVYARSHASERDVSPGMLGGLPMPELDSDAVSTLDGAAARCLETRDTSACVDAFIRLDAVIHALLGLRASDEWSIIDALAGRDRPGVGLYPKFSNFDRELPLYLQLGIFVPLPRPQIPEGLDRESLFEMQVAIYQELAALSARDIVGDIGESRITWLLIWKRELQEREADQLPLDGDRDCRERGDQGDVRANLPP